MAFERKQPDRLNQRLLREGMPAGIHSKRPAKEPRVELQQVRYFLAICDERNFTRAAQTCGVKQPSLTTAILRLERAIGDELFVRSSPVRLTALGSALQPLFAQIHETVLNVQYIAAAHRRNGAPHRPMVWSHDNGRDG